MSISCPVCEGDVERIDVPRHRLFVCTNNNCEEIIQLNSDNSVSPMGSILAKNELGDDRVRGAISGTHVTNAASFIDVFENSTRFLQMDLATASGQLRKILVQVENRIDFGISTFTGLDMASEEAAEGLEALREAREMISVLPVSKLGVRETMIKAVSGVDE